MTLPAATRNVLVTTAIVLVACGRPSLPAPPAKEPIVMTPDAGRPPEAPREARAPRPSRWSEAPAFPLSVSHHTIVALRGGDALVFGGSDDMSSYSDKAVRLDARTMTWRPVKEPQVPTEITCALRLEDGRVFVLSGRPYTRPIFQVPFRASIILYNPARDAITPGPSFAPNTTREICVELADGRVLIAGGTADHATRVIADVDIWNPRTGTIVRGPSMKEARQSASALRLADGRVLVVGGTSEPSAEIFDPVAKRWSVVAGVSGEGRLIATETGADFVLDDAVHAFDATTSTWTRVPVVLRATERIEIAIRLRDGRLALALRAGRDGAPLMAILGANGDLDRLDEAPVAHGLALDVPGVELDDGRILWAMPDVVENVASYVWTPP